VATRIGVDVGGTFTDLVAYDERVGEVVVIKELTTPESPEVGVLTAIDRGLSKELVGEAAYFLHGTTVGLNALLERCGAVVGLLCTQGFRDVLEVRRGDRDDPYDLLWKPPPPLVPRRLRLPVRGRMMADGGVRTPLSSGDVTSAAEAFLAERVTAVAIVFINAYANPAHELEAEDLLREAGFTGDISVSHRVSGEYREYERTCTTVVDAFVRHRMGPYLERLERGLAGLGFTGDALVTRSGGGSLPLAEATARPFETIMSGPVAGAQGAGELAKALGASLAVTADVGGTSFDTCLVHDGRPSLLYEGRIAGLPLQSPWVDVRSIGAGGGSIAYVDRGGLLRVGPQSAGASPGPACYGRGGTAPTVTDAALVLGMLGDGPIAGDLVLDEQLAAAALEPIRERLGFESADDVARGILRIAAASMADAIREIMVERGEDARRATLIAFGGAGPLFGTLLAQELGMTEIAVPQYAGSFSAWGLLGADVTRTAARTQILRLDEDGTTQAGALASELLARLAPEGRDGQRPGISLDMRYRGQEHTLTITAPCDEAGRIVADADELRAIFVRDYERTFAHSMEEEAEIVTVRASTTAELPPRRTASTSVGAGADAEHSVEVYSFELRRRVQFRVAAREAIGSGAHLEGPALLVEPTTSTYLDAGWSAHGHETGALVLERSGERQ
jgi:N-methylhydantoinase A